MKYIYKCNHCHYEFEKDLKLKDVARKVPKFHCPECGGTTRKLINRPVIHYKGEGFTLSKGK